MAKRFIRLVLCAGLLLTLTACESYIRLLQSLAPPESAQERAQRIQAAKPPENTPSMSPYELARELAQVDFRILTGRTRIMRRDYVLASAPDPRPQIIPLGNHVYHLKMVFDRDSRSSWRGDWDIDTHFFYDGTELVFFWDINNNKRFDRGDRNISRYRIDRKHGPPREVTFKSSAGYDVTLSIVFDRRF